MKASLSTFTLVLLQAVSALAQSNSCVQIQCPPDFSVVCGSNWSFGFATASTCCTNTNVIVSIVSTVTNGICPQVAVRTWRAMDSCSNFSVTCSQSVTLIDTNPPTITCATNKSVDCGDLWTFDPPSASDTCSGTNLTFTFTTVTNSTFPLVVMRTWTVKDACTNSATCSQTVTVRTNCCLTVSNDCVLCTPSGGYTYMFDIRNDSTQPAYYLALSDTNGSQVFNPSLIYLNPPLQPGEVRAETVAISSVPCGQLCFWVALHNQSFIVCCSRQHCITVPDCCAPRTYASAADFSTGLLVNLTNRGNNLCFPTYVKPFPYVNIACSGRGTIVRIDVNSCQVVGEYKSAPDSDYPYNPDPSRTTVDLYGNIWVANRSRNKDIYGTVTRYALVMGGTRGDPYLGADGKYHVNPNANGEYLEGPFTYNSGATARPTSPSHRDGLIHTSHGLGNILSWPGAEAGDGTVASADDECIINYTVVQAIVGSTLSVGSGIRTIAVDCNNDVWVGASVVKYANGVHQKLSGVTAKPVAGTAFTGPGTPGGYGGVIDRQNVLWSARGSSYELLRVDLNTAQTAVWGSDLGSSCGNYGLSVDPCSGNIWHTGVSGNQVFVRSPSGACLASYSELNPNFSTCSHLPTAQGISVDDRGNVWIAHAIQNNANTIGHLRVNGSPVGVVNLPSPPVGGHGPTGVAVDSNGKVWVSCRDSSKAMRIDPSLAGGIGAVDCVVDLNAAGGPAAGPYNYSDKTGFIALGVTCPSGFWDFVQDACTDGANWGKLSWVVSPGTQITVEVRAADNLLDLPTKLFKKVSSGISFCGSGVTGRHLEVRVRLFHNNPCLTDSTACLQSLTVQCCAPTSIWDTSGSPSLDWSRPVQTWTATPVTTNLPATITHPGGLAMQALWTVNGAVAQSNYISAGTPPTITQLDFMHTYQPGSNSVQLLVADNVHEPVVCLSSVTVGDITPPQWVNVSAAATNAYLGAVPVFQPVLADDCAIVSQINVTQLVAPGTIFSQGTYPVTLVANDPSGNRTTNVAHFTVAPVLTIISPSDYTSVLTSTGMPVRVQVASNVADVARVNYFLETNLVATVSNAPYSATLSGVAAGAYALSAQAVSSGGLTSMTPPVLVFFNNPPQPVAIERARIDIIRSSNGFILSWPGGWILQSADDALGPWSDVSDAANPYSVIANAGRKFFRLRE